jgi:hypothetical protein
MPKGVPLNFVIVAGSDSETWRSYLNHRGDSKHLQAQQALVRIFLVF